MHFFTQSSSSFRSTCPYQRSLFCCNTNAMSSKPSLSLSSLLGSLSFNLTPHIHLTILISARWSATTFSFLTGQVSLPCSDNQHRNEKSNQRHSAPVHRGASVGWQTVITMKLQHTKLARCGKETLIRNCSSFSLTWVHWWPSASLRRQ